MKAIVVTQNCCGDVEMEEIIEIDSTDELYAVRRGLGIGASLFGGAAAILTADDLQCDNIAGDAKALIHKHLL